jgi:catechol 2,3-dioxygenase-like lactoylglutathione lyase family enzyme
MTDATMDRAMDPTASLAPYFFQVAYVMDDIAAGARWFQATMGVAHFERLEHVTFGATCRFRGGPADCAAHLALGFAGDVQVELIEPAGGRSVYQEFLDAGRTGLHHVAFLVPDFSAATAGLAAQGLECVTEGVLEGGMRVEFAYFDAVPHAGSMIEILGFDEAAHAFMAELKRKGRD